ncbi:MAG: hypothetical protein WCP12_18120 [bacterium]
MSNKILFAVGLLFTLSVFAEPTTNMVYNWDYEIFPLASGSREKLWQAALATNVGGRCEVKIQAGKIDIETATEVYEVERQDNWKEGMGQAIAYATETKKKPVLALISSAQGPKNMQKRSRERFDFVHNICATNNVRLLVLFPSSPELPHGSK